MTSETVQVSARPQGGFVLQSDAVPVRARVKGRWQAVDTTLHPNSDGTLSPKVTAYGTLRLSGGGGRHLLTSASGSSSLTLTSPWALPRPAVAKNVATYASVLPGVDLVVTATETGGFSDVLVIKNPTAAADPRLGRVS